MCKKISEDIDIHHIVEQQEADKYGNIGEFHKNVVHNLMALCKECHREVHNGEKTIGGALMSFNGKVMV